MLALIDSAIIIFYLLALLVFGIFIGKREKLEDFLINNRKTRTFFLIFTIVSTNVGAGLFIGIAAAGYETGISFAISVIIAVFAGFLLMAFLAPRIKRFGDKYKAHTLAEFFGVRYSNSNRILVAGIIIINYFFWTAIQFVAFATLASIFTGWDFNIILVIAAVSTIIYTSFAGIKSDFYTDVIHFWVISLTLFLVLLPLVLIKAGGFSLLLNLPDKYYNIFSFGGPIFFFGAIVFGILVMLPGMEIWQRIYASTNEKEAKKALLWSAVLNIPFLIFAALLGLVAATMYAGINRDQALFILMKDVLPMGLLGLGIAGILALLISSVNTGMLVGSITILKDFYKNIIHKNASERNMLLMGRIFTAVFGFITLIVAYLFPDIIQLLLTSVYITLPFLPALLGGFFWKKATSAASFFSIIIGFIVTMAFLPFMPKEAFLPGILTSAFVFVLLSYLTKHSKDEKIIL